MADLPIITTMLEQVSWVPANPMIHVVHLTLEPGAPEARRTSTRDR